MPTLLEKQVSYEACALDHALGFSESLLYMTPEQHWAITLLAAVSHDVMASTTVPRGLFVSDDPGSGKTTGLHYMRMIGWRAWSGTNATEPAIKAKFIEGETLLLVDEISKLFGESGMNGKQSKLYTLLVAGYESGSTTAFSSGRVTEDVPIYGVACAAGLRKAAPSDLRDRSIIWQMKTAPAAVANQLIDALDSDTRVIGKTIGQSVHQWVRQRHEVLRDINKNRLRGIHPKLTGRRKQVWGPLFAVALAAGGPWPDRCLRAFMAMALDINDRPVLVPAQQMLLDAADFCDEYGSDDKIIFSRDLLTYVKSLDREMYDLSDRRLAMLMTEALGQSENIWGTYAYEPESEASQHKGWNLEEKMYEANDLRAKLNLVIRKPAEPDEFDTMFE